MNPNPNFQKSKGKCIESDLNSEKFEAPSHFEERKGEEEDLQKLKQEYLQEKMRKHAEKNKVTSEDIEDLEELIRQGLQPMYRQP